MQIDRLKKALMIFLFTVVVCGFYIGSYYYSSKIFQGFDFDLAIIDGFYARMACVSSLYFSLQKELFFNQKFFDNFYGKYGDIVYNQIDECNKVEENYRTILKNAPNSILKDKSDYLNSFNSDELCKHLVELNLNDEDCAKHFDGFFSLGLEQMMRQYIYTVTQKKINLDTWFNQSESFSQQQIRQNFFDKNTLYQTIVFFQNIPLLRHLQDVCDAQLQAAVQRDFSVILVIFSMFLVSMVILLCVVQLILIKNLLKKNIMGYLLLKMIPGFEYFRLQTLFSMKEKDNKRAIRIKT